MSRGEWNKKEELLAEQAAKHLRHYTPLLAAFAQSAKAEIALLTKVNFVLYFIGFDILGFWVKQILVVVVAWSFIIVFKILINKLKILNINEV